MRIITVKRLKEYAKLYPNTAATLAHWTALIEGTEFDNLVELRRALPTADQVEVASGRTVTIFNIKNHYRLITAVHYNNHLVYILLLLTHSDYDQNRWKKTL